MDLEAKIARSIKEDLADSSDFDRYFTFEHYLGKDSDGEVSAFLHRPSKRLIAVNAPRADRISASVNICREAKALKAISIYGKHENINHMISYQLAYGVTLYPAIILEYAQFGSLLDYRTAWREQGLNKALSDIPEPTVWKLFKDMTLALDFLHNKCGLVHRDVKTENILVTRSPTDYGSVIPKIPAFKLADFSRALAYPSIDNKIYEWAGSAGFAPPLAERQLGEPARAAGDMWSLGATLQEFAVGVIPCQSRKAFVEQMEKCQESHPKLEDHEEVWKKHEWKLCAGCRPLKLQATMLVKHCGLAGPLVKDYQPFSDVLNEWYRKLWIIATESRATSASLVKGLIPFIDCYIGVVKKPETHRTNNMLDMLSQVARPQAPTPRRMAGLRTPHGSDYRPTYEGNDYAVLSSQLRLRELD